MKFDFPVLPRRIMLLPPLRRMLLLPPLRRKLLLPPLRRKLLPPPLRRMLLPPDRPRPRPASDVSTSTLPKRVAVKQATIIFDAVSFIVLSFGMS